MTNSTAEDWLGLQWVEFGSILCYDSPARAFAAPASDSSSAHGSILSPPTHPSMPGSRARIHGGGKSPLTRVCTLGSFDDRVVGHNIKKEDDAMSQQDTRNERVRAWVFVHAEFPHKTGNPV